MTVAVTEEAADLLRRLSGRHGPSMFYQSDGCCDGSLPRCYAAGECLTGDANVDSVICRIAEVNS